MLQKLKKEKVLEVMERILSEKYQCQIEIKGE